MGGEKVPGCPKCGSYEVDRLHEGEGLARFECRACGQPFTGVLFRNEVVSRFEGADWKEPAVKRTCEKCGKAGVDGRHIRKCGGVGGAVAKLSRRGAALGGAVAAEALRQELEATKGEIVRLEVHKSKLERAIGILDE